MRRIVYTSNTAPQVGEAEMRHLVQRSISNNDTLGVTGILVWKRPIVIQIIEGENLAIDKLFSRISADKRHDAVLVLDDSVIEDRAFPQWSMKYWGTDDNKVLLRNQLPQHVRVLMLHVIAERNNNSPHLLDLLRLLD